MHTYFRFHRSAISGPALAIVALRPSSIFISELQSQSLWILEIWEVERGLQRAAGNMQYFHLRNSTSIYSQFEELPNRCTFNEFLRLRCH
jgi:hypothetical protein